MTLILVLFALLLGILSMLLWLTQATVGVGVIAFAILLDATIVRALLVPALMRLLGDLNWWAPKWMKRIYKRIGLDH